MNTFSHFTFHISLEVLIIIDNINVTFNMFMFNSNKPIRVAHLQKLANQSLLNGALVMEMGNNYFIESKKNLFDKAENVLIEKKKKRKI